MKVCLLGGNGALGPWVVEELERTGGYEIRITDLEVPDDSPHETLSVDIADAAAVRRAAEGCDVIVNCSVSRQHRKVAWDVNTVGTYNAISAAVDLGHERFINTGPHFTITGDRYYAYDFDLVEEVPAHSGTDLYAISKAAGQDLCRVFTDNHPIHCLCLLFLNFRAADPRDPRRGGRRELAPFAVTFPDAARAVRGALAVGVGDLPSRNEIFYVTTDLPHGKYSNAKARRLLGFEPQDSLEAYWRESTG